MVKFLRVLFAFIFLFMVGITIWASMDRNVIIGFKDIAAQPWGAATLADAYFAFLTFYVWVFYKEAKWLSKILWFVIIMIFGNIGMAAYMLIVLSRAGSNARVEDILLRRPA